MIGHLVVGLALLVAPLAPAAAQQPDKLQPATEIIAALPATLVLALSAVGPSAAAQEAGGVDRLLAQMPKKLDGAPAVNSSSGILMYTFSEPGGKLTMVVALAVVEKEGFVSPEELRRRALEMVKDFGIRQVIREGRFATPKWPGAPTFFGEYVTDKGFTQSWSLVTGKEAMNVTTVYAKRKDAGRAEALVAGKILGGAVISAAKPAE